MIPIPLGIPIPKHCRKLKSPKIAPAAAPPAGPIATAQIATGIIFIDMDNGPIGMVPIGVQAKISNTAVISAIMVKLLVLVFLIISSLLLFPSGIQYGDGRTGFCPKSG